MCEGMDISTRPEGRAHLEAGSAAAAAPELVRKLRRGGLAGRPPVRKMQVNAELGRWRVGRCGGRTNSALRKGVLWKSEGNLLFIGRFMRRC